MDALDLIRVLKCLVQIFKLTFKNSDFSALSAERLLCILLHVCILKGCLHSSSASWRTEGRCFGISFFFILFMLFYVFWIGVSFLVVDVLMVKFPTSTKAYGEFYSKLL